MPGSTASARGKDLDRQNLASGRLTFTRTELNPEPHSAAGSATPPPDCRNPVPAPFTVRATTACRRCAARRGIHQPVPVHLPAHQQICTHHGLWLSPAPRPQLDLTDCPEIIAAQRRADRLLRRCTPQQLIFAELNA